MPKRYLTGLALLLSFFARSQSYTISGYLEDQATGEKLIAANVYDSFSGAGAVTNTYGFFSLTLPADSVALSFSYIGYQSQEERFVLSENRTLNVSLSPYVELVTVEVTAERGDRIEERTQMSRVEVPIEQIKRIPALLGEVDVLKALQLLPGVQSGGEGQNGLYVRGGSPDQNLVLLDGVPVYNVSHLLGIFSVFNADAIKNVTLTKGGFPARYGGRLSSVLEINMKEGNLQEWHGEGSIGLISSKLTLQGPIQKGKTSFLISGRRTYADLIFKPIIKANTPPDETIDVGLYFYDLNAKIQHKINDKHRVFLSAYTGADVFTNRYADEFGAFSGGIDWGNLISAARWNWQISPKMFANTTLTYSKYEIDISAGSENFNENGPDEKFSALYVSGIEDIGGKIDFDFIPNPNHYLRFGAGWTNHTYRPGALNFELTDGEDFNLDTLIGSQNSYSNELFLYVEDDFTLGPLKINAGIHASAFAVEDEFYTSIQPRVGLRYLLDNDLAIKAGFSTMTQYINLLTSEALSLPSDLWVPSTAKIKPQQSWQVALGVAKTINDDYELSVEGYYKEMQNVISFKEGASFLFGLENDWQSKVTQGDGESYGLELFFQKKRGRTTGWIGYTLSWNYRQFDEINSGRKFPFRYDRRHDVSVVVNHDFSEKIGVSAAWVYGTGNAITLNTITYPNSVYGGGGSPFFNEIETGGEKNAFRMSDFHRLDLSVEFRKQKPKWERKWVIGVYNAYYHRNPYYVIADTQYVRDAQGNVIDEKRVFKEISILPIIPSVSYQFKF
ncbi:TonB-dependent receptor [Lewinella cohaerens]|uniref:TonB-dependent receptor n=1 Tax=Lewinella cohaerens TaxID=70995 RepID=UPI00037121A8|nr:carboxypeptidase-like regulatory domain-containing protein [Lewinella cohaerens]